MAFRILQAEAEYRSKSDNPQGIFFFQFEAMCRNRLNYDRGLKAMSDDAGYDSDWNACDSHCPIPVLSRKLDNRNACNQQAHPKT